MSEEEEKLMSDKRFASKKRFISIGQNEGRKEEKVKENRMQLKYHDLSIFGSQQILVSTVLK